MSQIASYARLSGKDVDELKVDPDKFWRIQEMPRDLNQNVNATASERIELDKDWQVLSWLCSRRGRAEERHRAALVQLTRRNRKAVDLSGDAFKAALSEQAQAMGFAYIDPWALPLDPVLTAIRGRRQDDGGPSIANLGLAAALFGPEEVRGLASELDCIDETELRESFDVNEMRALDLPGDWEVSEFDQFYLPQLRRLKTLYRQAAKAGQYLVVVIS